MKGAAASEATTEPGIGKDWAERANGVERAKSATVFAALRLARDHAIEGCFAEVAAVLREPDAQHVVLYAER